MIKFIRNKASVLIYKIFCLFVKKVVLSVMNYKIIVNINKKFRFSNFKSIKKIPHHEPEVIEQLMDLKNINSIVNIGSNIGLYCILFEKIFPNSKIIGFEPNFVFYKESLKNINLNKCKNIKIINKAVGNNNEIQTSYIISNNTSHHDTNTQLIKLDSYLSDFKVDLIFIDVDGFEFDVLEGSKEILKNKPTIIMEIHPNLLKKNNIDMTKIFFFLKEYDYKFKFLRYPDKPTDHKQIHYCFY